MFPKVENIKLYIPGFSVQNNIVKSAVKIIKTDGKVLVFNSNGAILVNSSFTDTIQLTDEMALCIFEEIKNYPQNLQQMPESLRNFIRCKMGTSSFVKEERIEFPEAEIQMHIRNLSQTANNVPENLSPEVPKYKFPMVSKTKKSTKSIKTKEQVPGARKFRGNIKSCDFCKFQTDSIFLIKQHLLDKHQKGKAIICSCGFYLGSQRHLIRHREFSSKNLNVFQETVNKLKVKGLLCDSYEFKHNMTAEIDAGTEGIGKWMRRDLNSYINHIEEDFSILMKNRAFVIEENIEV